MSLLDTLTGTGKKFIPEETKPSGKGWEKGKKFSYMSLNKRQILEKYPKVFTGIRISDIKGAPILMPRARVVKKMEEIYNEQFHRLLKSKTLRVLNLPKVTYDVTKNNVKSSSNYFVQSLTNLMYSADKYGDYPEVSQFLKFIQGPTKDLTQVYYIYIRQNFKILTYNSFFNHKKTPLNPLLIDISYSQALDIIEQAFYYEDLLTHDLLAHIKTKVKPKTRIKYYDFLLALLEPDVGYRDLELMNYLIALYNIKKPEFLLDEATLTQGMRSGNTGTMGGTGLTGIDEADEDATPAWENDAGGDEDGAFGAFGGQEVVTGHGVAGFEDESLYLEDNRVINKYKNKIKSQEVKLQKNIKGIMKKVVQSYINQFKKKYSHEELSKTREGQIYDRVYLKIFNLTTVIFYADRKKYFDLLRVANSNKQAQELWLNMSKQYLYMKELNTFSEQVAKDFIKTWLSNSLVNLNIKFFLSYEYGCPNAIIDDALKIDEMSDEE